MKARDKADSAGRAGIDIYIKELAWREFYFAILHHFPNVLDVVTADAPDAAHGKQLVGAGDGDGSLRRLRNDVATVVGHG